MYKKGIIFDLDGTLWDSSEQVVPAWNIVFNRYQELNKSISLDDMKSFMGKTIEDIAGVLLPDIDRKRGIEILKECCKEEQIYLKEHGGKLYPELEEVLTCLSEKYFLYIVSNCQDGYVQAFLQHHIMDGYFKDFEMSGRTGKKKSENIKLIIERNKLDETVYIGDTIGDYEAASEAGIPFVYAAYGFGKIINAKYSILQISELPELIKNIS